MSPRKRSTQTACSAAVCMVQHQSSQGVEWEYIVIASWGKGF